MRLTTLEGQYQCIVIDPPWFYRLRNQDKTHRNRINYKPMHIEEILSLPVPGLSDHTGSVLWLWFTNNHMIEAAHCLETWGFELKTIWEQREKVRSGFCSQLHPYILNKTWFFSCDRILKQAIYVPGFSTSQNRVAPRLF